MRPAPLTADASSRRGTRSAGTDDLPSSTPVAQLSCFITTEADLDLTSESSRPEVHAYKRSLSSSPLPSGRSGQRRQQPKPASPSDVALAISKPLAPTFIEPFGPASDISIPSSPEMAFSSSLSEEPDSMSLAELSPVRSPHQQPASNAAGSSIPQLVMPSLSVPRRRPFSEVGRSLGRLTLLVTGQAG